MANSLEGTIFQSASTDRILVADPVTIKDNTPRSTPSTSMLGRLKGVLGKITPALSAGNEIRRLVEQMNSGWIDKSQLLSRGMEALGTSMPAVISSLSSPVKALVGETTFDLITDTADKAFQVVREVDGIIRTFDHYGDLNSAYDIMNMARVITGNDQIAQMVGLEAETAAMAGVVNAITESGMYELVDDVLAVSSSNQVKLDAMIWVAERSIQRGDLDALEKAIEVSGPTAVSGGTQDILSDFRTTIAARDLSTSAAFASLGDRYKTVMSALDPTWNQVSDLEGGYGRLDGYMGGNEIFDEAMSETSLIDRVMVMTGKAYDFVDDTVTGLIDKMYPGTVVRSDRVELDPAILIARNSGHITTPPIVAPLPSRGMTVS